MAFSVTRGFILQASYRVTTVPGGGRVPVVHLYGRLADGGTFLVRDDRQHPHFYVRAGDAARAAQLGATRQVPIEKRTFDGEPVVRVETTIPADVPDVRDRLHANGIDTFEADVRFATRYLIERGIKGGCEIHGEPVGTPVGPSIGEPLGVAPGAANLPPSRDPTVASTETGPRNTLQIFHNPVLRPASVSVDPVVLSFDIETDPKGNRLLAISMYAPGLDEVLIVDGSGRPMPENATACVNEYAALEAFTDRIRTLDPDVITGWNIIDFDLSVLEKIAARVRHPFQIGRDVGALRVRKAEGYFGSGQATIPGRVVLDGIDLLRGAFVRMEDYSLDAVSRSVLGEGKAVKGDVKDRLAEIISNYRYDLPAFALYARTDSRLAYEIVHKLDLVRLAFARSQLAGMTPDRVAASIASFDFVYLSELEKRGIVAPSVRSGDSNVSAAAQQGGHVLEPDSGVHRNVWVFDFKSLYPSIIRTFNIDPLSYVPEPLSERSESRPNDDLIVTPGGAFRREPAILPGLLDELFPRREAAREAGDSVASNAIKILMNSFYGVLGTSACRFYNPALANSITGTGKEILLWSKAWFEERGFRVLYGDTDSLFVSSGKADAEGVREQGAQLARQLNEELASYITERWHVTSRLSLKFEKLYLRLFLSRARNSTRGASKRYAGLRQGANPAQDENTVEFVGMEVVRSDWTALAKQVQRELYERLFNDQPVDVYLADVVRQVRAGKLDDSLVYRKNLRKRTQEYTATTPPHVAAARKSSQPMGRSISYVMTTAGPEPMDNVQHALDREHYVQKQVKPVAEPVLETLGLDFELTVGDQGQLRMF